MDMRDPFSRQVPHTHQRHFLMKGMWLVLALLVTVNPHFSHSQEISIGVDEWPPFASETAPLPNKGLSVEILNTVFKAAGYTPTIKVLPWPRVIRGLERGKLDAIGNLWYTDAIAKWAIYSTPYHHSHLKFITSKNKTVAFETLQDLKPFKIGIGIGYTTNTDFDTSTELKKIEIPLSSNGMKMILLGRLDMVLDSEEVFLYLLCHDLREAAKEFKILEKSLIPSPIYVGVAKNHPQGETLIQDFNANFSQLNEQGVIQEIVERHLKMIQCHD